MSNSSAKKNTSNTIVLTTLAMIAFAANSVLCRQALTEPHIDAASFTTIRMVSGAITLFIILQFMNRSSEPVKTNWKSVLMLFAYMVFFSFAYISLSAGTGALLLFGAVQLTMFIVGLVSGERFSPLSWLGLLVASAGIIYLVLPGVTAPDPLSAVLMIIAGIAWGYYSLLGQGSSAPLLSTSKNFTYSIPLVLIVSVIFFKDLQLSDTGIWLAIASGAIASGCGYVIWYAVLPSLSATRAATVQLTVPIIAAFGGAVFISEQLDMKLAISALLTLGGVAIVLSQKSKQT